MFFTKIKFCKTVKSSTIGLRSYHGSNSWMMLSNLMTAKSLDENPASHARANTVKTIKLLAPEGFNNLEELDIAWAG